MYWGIGRFTAELANPYTVVLMLQDYHSAPDVYDRSQLMIHVFFYLNGLDGQVGDLMILPRSQYSHWDGGSMQAIFKDAVLPCSKTFNNLPPGSAVICHSALVHGRRAQPGGEDKPRYFLDISYCRERKQSPVFVRGVHATAVPYLTR